MQCVYINLDSQRERRLFVEHNFDACRKEGWTLTRFGAVDATEVQRLRIPGKITDAEKGCFLSHLRAIETSAPSGGHVLIMEDDALLGPHSCHLITAAANAMPADKWDILFTDVCISAVPSMLELFVLRREFMATRQFNTVNLKDLRFAGATAYVVNARSRQKLIGLLKGESEMDLPYDLFLRGLIYQSVVAGFVVFPFATSLSEHAEKSQLQSSDTEINDATWNAFRKLMWVDRDVADATRKIDLIGSRYTDQESAAFARILSLMLSPRLPEK